MTNNFKNLLSIGYQSQGISNTLHTYVAYIQYQASWKENKYLSNCRIYDIKSGKSYNLTNSGDVNSPIWYNDSLLLLKNDSDQKSQVWLYENLTGEPIQLTYEKEGVSNFKIFNDGVVFITNEQKRFDTKERKESYGSFTYVESEKSTQVLKYFKIDKAIKYNNQRQILEEENFKKILSPVINLTESLDFSLHIQSYVCAEDTERIFVTFRENSDLVFSANTRQIILDVSNSSLKEYSENISREEENSQNDENLKYQLAYTSFNLPEGSVISGISPDETKLLLSSKERDTKFYTQADLWILDVSLIQSNSTIDFHSLVNITKSIDQSIMSSKWTTKGIFVSFFENTTSKILKIDHHSNYELNEISLVEEYHGAFFSADREGGLVVTAYNKNRASELLYYSEEDGTKIITQNNEKFEEYQFVPAETITWKSQDGTEVSGIIRKPKNFDTSKKYPLAFVVHGGPSWISMETQFTTGHLRYYPVQEFANQGIITVEPNYRGSIGKGQEFLELNVDNLGVGDLWDVESCIDYLAEEGYIDESKIVCMGWSQGGYISAIATTHSSRFIATSVGAGISDWYSYYITTDIRQFTRHYLSDNPFENREIYVKTSPMAKLNKKSTPALIQIGENDKRVPLVNATELYRGLEDMGVESHLFIYSGMPHGINKPKENLAVVTQNYQWFMHKIFGNPLDFFPALQEKEDS